MNVLLIGLQHLAALASGRVHSAKLVFNAAGAIFLPTAGQHRDAKAGGISYEDNYKGNALAAMLTPGKMEIRYHQAYTDRDVAQILTALLASPELAPIASWQVTYQGRAIEIARGPS